MRQTAGRFLSFFLILTAGAAGAATYTWDGGAGDGIWQTGTSVNNWDPNGYAPGNGGGNNFIFTKSGAGAPSTISLQGGHGPNVNNLLLNGNKTPLTFTIANTSGTHLDLVPTGDDAETITVTAGSYTISGSGTSDGAIQLFGGSGTGYQTFNIYSGASLTINAQILDLGYSRSVIKSGAGTLTMGAAIPLTMGMKINQGSVFLGVGGSLGYASAITIASGATLHLSGGANNQIQQYATTPSLTINGTLNATTAYAHTLYSTSIALNNGKMISSGGGQATYGTFYVANNSTITATGASNSIEGTNNAVGINGGVVLTLNTPASSDALTVSGNVVNGNSGTTGGLTKTGDGTLTFTGTNTYSGDTTVSNGVVTFSGTAASSGGTAASLRVGGMTGKGVLNMNSSGTLAFSTTGGTVYIGASSSGSSTGLGAFTQTAGTVNMGRNNSSGYILLGSGDSTTYGSYDLSGGVCSGGGWRVGAGGLGSFVQSGGYLYVGSRYFVVGNYFGGPAGCTNGVGVATFTGGGASSAVPMLVGDSGVNANGTLNIGTEVGGSATVTNLNASGIVVGSGGGSGKANLNSGTIVLSSGSINKTGTGTGILNLNGGTLCAGGNVTLINTTLDSVNVFKGGVTFDSQGYNAAVSANLAAAAGNGIYPTGGVLTISSGGGSGYIGPPLVTVSGGSGSGAMAIANVSGGVVTGVTLTCPGQNYQAGETLSFAFDGGGCDLAASTFNYTLLAGDLATSATGGLTKAGSGVLTLSGTNSYSGDTYVQSGVLTLSGAYTGSGTHHVPAGTTLRGSGAIAGIEVADGGTLSPGTVAGAPGALTLSGDLDLSGATIPFDVSQTLGGSGTNDLLDASGALNVSGVNTVAVNVTVFPPVQSTTLIRFSSLAGSGSFVVTGVPSTIVATLTTNATSLDLNLTPLSRDLKWTGGNGATWDVAATTNWMLSSPDDEMFLDYDTVTFGGDGAANNGVTINGTVQPGGVTVDAATDYSFNGPGGIGGIAALTQAGSGTLIISSTNSYSGTTVVSNGVLRVNGANGSAGLLAGTPSITVCSGATLELAAGDALGWTAGKEALVIQGGGLVTNTVANKRISLASMVAMTGGTLAAAGDGDSNGAYSFNSTGVAATSDPGGNPARITARCSVQTTSATMNVTRGPALPESDMIISAAIIPYDGTAYGIAKTGDGILTLAGTNTYTGSTTVSGGVLEYGDGSSSSGGGALYISTSAGNRSIVKFGSTNAATFNGTFNLGGGVTGAGAFYQLAGTVNAMNNTAYIDIGNGGYGSYVLTDGTLNLTSASGIRVGGAAASGVGILTQTGGTLNLTRYLALGSGSGSVGVMTLAGGALNGAVSYTIIVGDSYGTGILNIGTAGGGSGTLCVKNSGGIIVNNAASTTSAVNLNSGTVLFDAGVIKKGSAGTGLLNLNGGTLRANAAGLTLIDGTLNSVNVYRGGATVDTQANSATISGNLLPTAGNGMYPAGGTLAVTSGGSGYVGAPLVTVSGGSGTGAMAVANISILDGAIASVELTCPGQNYQAGDSVTFTFTGGGAQTPASPFVYTLQAGDVAANGGGALTKTGAGTLTLSGANSYDGNTIVSEGALTASGGHTGTGTHRALAGATLQGTGTVHAIAVEAGGILSPGVGGVGKLTVTGDMALDSATIAFDVAQGQSGNGTNDLLDIGGAVDVTGVSTIAVHVTSLPPVHQVTVSRFSSLTGSGEFAVSGLPATIIGTLITNATSLVLNLELAPQDLTWTGGNGATWDVAGTTNWMVDVADDAMFYDLDRVTFDETGAAHSTVTVNGTVQPGSVTVDSASDYTFNGAGIIGGTGTVAKAGSGTLTLTATNTYTGATTINGGAIVLGVGGALPGSALITVGSNAALYLSGSANNQIQISAASPSLTISGMLEATTTSAHTLCCTNTVLNNGRMVSSGGGNATWGTFHVGNSRLITATGPSNSIEGSVNTLGIVNGAVLTLDTPNAGDALAVSGSIVNRSGHTTGALTKTGAGMLTLTGANTYGGSTIVSNGVMTYSGSGGSSGTVATNLVVGGAAGKAVLNMNSSGTLTFGTTTASSSYIGGTASGTSDTGAGAVSQTSGTVGFGTGTGCYLWLGAGGSSAYGSYNLSGGTLNTSGIQVGLKGYGSYVQSAGYMNANSWRYFVVAGDTNSAGVATFTGGTVNVPRWTTVGAASNAVAALNIGTLAGGAVTYTNGVSSANSYGVILGDSGATGVFNLNSGTLVLGAYSIRGRINGTTGTGVLNLNGGTIKANTTSTLIDTTLTSVNVFKGGVTFDTQANTSTVSANLLATTGNGIYPSGGTLTISSDGGSGYIGAPLVTVSGGSGSGAMAVANVSGGVVTGVTLTCPGQNYQAGDNLSFAFAGGGYDTAASAFDYTLLAGDVADNATGGVTKIGSGTLTLSGTNSYGGDTIVQGGALTISGRLTGAGTCRVLSGGTLQGTGTVNRAEVQAGGILSPGVGGVGTLTITGNLAVSGAAIAFDVAQGQGGAGTNDLLDVGGVLDVTGVSTIAVHVTALPPAQQVTVVRFSSLTGSGDFAISGLPATIFGTLTTNATSLVLNLEPVPQELTWTGGNGATWDVAGTTNWMVDAADDAMFYDLDRVTFDDTGAAHGTVTLNGTVQPGTVTVVSASHYTFNGPGGIGGVGGLTKAGSGTLTLTCTNTYTGPTVVSNGVLRVNGASGIGGLLSGTPVITVCSNSTLELAAGDALGWTAGKEALVIQSGALVSNTVANKRVSLASTVTMTGGTLAAAGDGDSNGAYSFNSSGVAATSDADGNPARITARCSPQTTSATMNVTRGPALPESDMIISGALIPYSTTTHGIVKTGDGVLTLGGSNSYSGGTTISAGTLCVSSNENLGAAAGTVTFNGGTLKVTGGFDWGTRPFTVNAGTSYVEVATGVGITGSSTFTGSGTLVKTGGGRLQFGNTGTGWGGVLHVDAGIVRVYSSRLVNLTALVVNSGGQYSICDDGVFTYDISGTLTLSGDGPDGSGALRYSTQGAPVASTATVNRSVILAGDTTISAESSGANVYNLKLNGVISGGAASLTKTGSGVLTLGGTNTYTGGTTVEEGTLALSYRSVSVGCVRGTLTVEYGALADCTVNNALGYSSTEGVTNLTVKGGTLRNSSTGSQALWDVHLEGGTLTGASGSGHTEYGNFTFYSGALRVTHSGNVASTIAAVGANSKVTIQGTDTTLTFDVGDGTPAVDLLVEAALVPITGATNNGLRKTGAGTMELTGASTYTGATSVDAGALYLNGAGRIAESSAVNVTGSGLLYLSANGSLDDNTILTIAGGGAQVSVEAGVDQRVKKLYLGSALAWRGTWGHTGSPARYQGPDYDAYFADNDGVITVSEGAPHPATVVIFR